MNTQVARKDKGIVELTIELSAQEFAPYLEQAAKEISTARAVAGFRPGAAPVAVVMRERGAMVVLEEAAQFAVPSSYTTAVREQNLETVGSPSIDVIKLAPENPFIFKATVTLLPEVTLGDYAAIALTKKHTKVQEKEVGKVLEDLRKMRTVEVLANREVQAKDKVVVDMAMTLDAVPIEGGDAKKHAIYMEEPYYIEGFKEKILGAKAGDAQTFKLPFPKTHYNKNLAGKDVDFAVTVKEVFELQKPPLDDAFAKTIGQTDIASLKTLIQSNLAEEAKMKDDQAFELELLEKAVAKTKIQDIPEKLLQDEATRMAGELEHRIGEQGMEFNDYLQKIHKTREQLLLDFAPEAVKRLKTTLMLRAIIKEQEITVTPEEIDQEIRKLLSTTKDQKHTEEQLKDRETRDYVHSILRNRKAIAYLTTQAKVAE